MYYGCLTKPCIFGIPQQHVLVAKRYATYLRIIFICFVVLLMPLGLHRYAYIVHTVPNR